MTFYGDTMINKNIIFAEENIIAHGCNCQGKMNSGVAKAIRNRWPHVYVMYYSEFLHKSIKLGEAMLIPVDLENAPNYKKIVANCYTQEFYGYDDKPYASIEAIKSSLTQVADYAVKQNFSVALPPIGCGLGGLSWNDVGPVVEKIFNGRGVRFQVYDYRAENWQK